MVAERAAQVCNANFRIMHGGAAAAAAAVVSGGGGPVGVVTLLPGVYAGAANGNVAFTAAEGVQGLRCAGDASGGCVLDGGGAGRGLSVVDTPGVFSIEGIAFIGFAEVATGDDGDATGNGGAVVAVNADVHLSRVNVSGCSANGVGGGVAATQGSTVVLRGCIFSENWAGTGGGAAAAISGSTLIITDSSLLSENEVDPLNLEALLSEEVRGGAVSALGGSTVRITNGTVLINNALHFAHGYGGAVGAAGLGTSVEISADGGDDVFVGPGNFADEGGGAVAALHGAHLQVGAGVVIAGNTALRNGGGLYLSDGATAVLDAGAALDEAGASAGAAAISVSDNVAGRAGGGIQCSDCWLTLFGVDVSGNSATSDGGGLAGDGPRAIAVTGSVVRQNHADEGGGVSLQDCVAGDEEVAEVCPAPDPALSVSSQPVRADATTDGGIPAYFGAPLNAPHACLWMSGTALVDNVAQVGAGGGLLGIGLRVYVHALTARGNTAEGDGGSIALSDSIAAVTLLTVDDSTADSSGGGVSVDRTVLQGNGVTVRGSTAGDGGGGLFITACDAVLPGCPASVVLQDAVIRGCEGGAEGGGISVAQSTLLLRESSLEQCVAGVDGGGIIASGEGTHILIDDSVISRCITGDDGGGIVGTAGANVTLVSSQIVDCQGSGNGGAVQLDLGDFEEAEFRAVHSIFDGNIGGTDGGTIFSLSSAVTLINVTLRNGVSARGAGAGIYARGAGAVVTMSDGTAVTDCAALGGGGGALAATQGASISMHDSRISKCLAVLGPGGGILADSGSAIDLVRTSIDFCSSYGLGGGGGIHALSSVVNVTDSTVEYCLAWFDGGGGISVGEDSALRIESSVLQKNVALPSGGAVRVVTGSRFDAFDVDFERNVAIYIIGGEVDGPVDWRDVSSPAQGGAVLVDTSACSIDSCRFRHNEATWDLPRDWPAQAGGHGGALYATSVDRVSRMPEDVLDFDNVLALLPDEDASGASDAEDDEDEESGEGDGDDDDGDLPPVQVTRCYFEGNRAFVGGAIFLGDDDTCDRALEGYAPPLTPENANTCVEYAAVRNKDLGLPDNDPISDALEVMHSTFVGNTATLVGQHILWSLVPPIGYDPATGGHPSLTFSGAAAAASGGPIASPPYGLRALGPDGDVLTSRTVLPDTQWSQALEIVDFYGVPVAVLGIAASARVQVSSGGGDVALQGDSDVPISTSTSVVEFTDLLVLAPPGSVVTLAYFIETLEFVPAAIVTMRIVECPRGSAANGHLCVPCEPGTANNETGGTCTACPRGAFAAEAGARVCTACNATEATAGSVARGSGSHRCSPCEGGLYASPDGLRCLFCPRGGDCRGGQLVAQPSFWGAEPEDELADISVTQPEFSVCPHGYCCQLESRLASNTSQSIGEDADGADVASGVSLYCAGIDSCQGNRAGRLCGRCAEGYSQSVISPMCVADELCNDGPSFHFGLFVLMVTLMTFLLFNPGRGMRSSTYNGATSVIVYFYQCVALSLLGGTGDIADSWSTVVTSALDLRLFAVHSQTASGARTADEDATSWLETLCPYPGLGTTGFMLLRLIQPVVVVVALLVLYGLRIAIIRVQHTCGYGADDDLVADARARALAVAARPFASTDIGMRMLSKAARPAPASAGAGPASPQLGPASPPLRPARRRTSTDEDAIALQRQTRELRVEAARGSPADNIIVQNPLERANSPKASVPSPPTSAQVLAAGDVRSGIAVVFSRAAALLALFAYSSFLQAVFDLLHCTPVAGEGDKLFIFKAAEVECITWWQVLMALGIGIPLLILPFVYAWLVARWWRSPSPAKQAVVLVLASPFRVRGLHPTGRSLSGDEETPERQGSGRRHATRRMSLLRNAFGVNTGLAFWGGVLMLRRLVLVLLSSALEANRVARATSHALVAIIALCSHIVMNPFASPFVNRLETALLFLLVVCYLLAIPVAAFDEASAHIVEGTPMGDFLDFARSLQFFCVSLPVIGGAAYAVLIGIRMLRAHWRSKGAVPSRRPPADSEVGNEMVPTNAE